MTRSSPPRPIKGTQSLYGEPAERFHHVIDCFDRVRRLYGFRRVEVPVFEATGVFARTMGETTDVVSKEMWSFESRSEGSVTLRPEFTAGIARAFLSEGWQQHVPMKVAVHGPAFRYERPQKGRYRQFHQLDAEVIGSDDPLVDVELLAFGAQLLEELGIEGVTLRLNTLGDAQSRDNWRAALIEHFSAHRDELSEDSRDRLERNPLRILDSKDPRDRPFAQSAPTMQLSSEAEDFFGQVRAGLDAAGIAYQLDPHLVRGLDYYRHTAFEFVTDRLGAQGTVLAGGRYDGLIEALGGPHVPAVGWAAGIERLAMLLDRDVSERIEAAILPMGEEARLAAIHAATRLRAEGISAEIFASGKLGKRMSRADQAGALAAIVIGEEEVTSGQYQYKHLASGEQRALDMEAIIDALVDEAAERDLSSFEADLGDHD
ncbi:histidine--tRNA ligase [Sphingomicrobium lutaoense]|uniref:Histidine--tRNA ligase n=1 Tax=Sphingomicrobium lutaoense TaxID=515949 RepID=A0A839Z2W3_9SPHN|nr:histidine--tRNA ligase [Sphingomicrobium lutaoense]MBB3764888.1 histidyl-tRNA synthetase [Sphingomicrobium lutaoense]